MTTSKTPKKPAPGKAIANWNEELAKYAQAIADNEHAGGTGLQTFATQGGILSLDDAPMPGNQMAVIILSAAYENVFFEGQFDPKNPQPPTCFAQALKETELAPHATVVERGQAQNAECEGCPMNAFGTADTGRGKACKNSRRLIVIPAGSYDKRGELTILDETDHYQRVEGAFLKVPVTSVRGYVSYVKQLATLNRKPPFAVITRVALVPDPRNQWAMTFELVREVDSAELFEVLLKRHREADELVLQAPYNLDPREAPPPRRGAPARGGKPAPRGKPAPAPAAPKRQRGSAPAPAPAPAAPTRRKY